MPEHAGLRPNRAFNCLEHAKEAMGMAEQAQSVELREELLQLAMAWLKLAHELEKNRRAE